MNHRNLYRYCFEEAAPLDEVEGTLALALVGVECLFGAARARLDVGHHFDEQKRACVIDASTPPGRALAKLFTGLLSQGLGPDAFRVERLAGGRRSPAPAA
jgi:hypothetical protein